MIRREASWPVGVPLALGTVWGLGVARLLAATVPAFPFGPGGAGAGGLVGAMLALLAAHALRRRGEPPAAVVRRMMPLALPLVGLVSPAASPWQMSALLLTSLALTLLPSPLPRRWGLVLAALVPLALYLPDISPYVGRADTFEFQVVAPRLGIAHPSGYPLYILIGKLFSLLPLGTVAWRINLSSAIFAALASTLLYLALTELEDAALPALLTALTFAFTPTLWSRAVEAEVYALNAAIVALGLWPAARWAAGHLDADTLTAALGLLTGVGMASHLTLGALALLTLPLVLAARPSRRALLRGAALGLLGVALYLYIPLRWPAVTGRPMDAAHFLRFVTNAESGGALRPLAFVRDPARWTGVYRLIRAQVGLAGIALALGGLVNLARRHPPLAAGTALAFGAWLWFALSFYVAEPDYSAFLIPAHAVLVLWLGISLSALVRQLPAVSLAPLPRLAVVMAALLPASRIWLTGPALETRAQGFADEMWGRYALAQPLAPGGAILADSEKHPPLYYLQQVEGLRPDLEIATYFDEGQYRRAMEARLARGQAVYLARYLPGLDVYGVSSVGPLVAVSPTLALDFRPLVTFTTSGGGALGLAPPHLEADPFGRAMGHLTLTWHVYRPVTEDLAIRLRLRTPEGAVVWALPERRPVSGYTVTSAWRQGMTIRDYHPLPWPSWLPAGRYRLEVSLAPRFAERGLRTTEGASWIPLGEVTLPFQEAGDLPIHLEADFGGTRLRGADLPAEAWVGTPMAVVLAWQSRAEADGAILARWVPVDGEATSATPVAPLGGGPIPAGRTVARRYLIPPPSEPGRYRLEIGRMQGGTLTAARCAWLTGPRPFCPLGEVRVGPANVGLANFEGKILLLAATMDATEVPAGGRLHVRLRWRALREMAHDYTVFVQVVGPDGQLYGQVDSWPVHGTRPTGGWATGEELDDAYDFYVKADAPPGTYRVIVGWYLLADMHRLPVVDAQGRARGDFYTVGTFTLP